MAEPARRAAVIGTPIAHSLSPALHRAAYASLGLNWSYEAIEVDEAGLAGFLAGLDGSWAGLSLTMPLKEEAARLLADVDPTARALRSVNTVLPGESGWRGTNTDVYGMTQALTRAGLAGRPAAAVVLGAGATARSAVAALAALDVPHVTVCARRAEAATEVAALARELGLTAGIADLTPDAGLIGSPVVVSTLPGAVAAPWAALAAVRPRRAAGCLLPPVADAAGRVLGKPVRGQRPRHAAVAGGRAGAADDGARAVRRGDGGGPACLTLPRLTVLWKYSGHGALVDRR